MSQRYDDITLMAYADGALEPRLAAEVKAYLDTDPEAQRIVDGYLRTAILARRAFEADAAEPVPQRLIDTLMAAPGGSHASVVRQPAASQRRRGGLRVLALPLAACVALMIAVGGLLVSQRLLPGDTVATFAPGPVAAGTALARLLETQPSGGTILLDGDADGRQLAILATYRDRASRVCREIEVQRAAPDHAPTAAGIACRDAASGRWAVEGAVTLAEPAGGSGPGYVPSGMREADAMRGLLEALGASAALPQDAERTLLDRGWK